MEFFRLTQPDMYKQAQTLRDTDAGTGFMHESFQKDDPQVFTRAWFAWANTLFGELVLDVVKRNPELVI